MRLHPCTLLTIVALATACTGGGSDDDDDGSTSATPTPTASPSPTPAPFDCEDDAAPGSAVDPLVVSGVVSELTISGVTPSIDPVSGADVTAFRAGSGTSLGTDTTGGDGTYSISVATGATPYDAILRVTRTGDRTVAAVPANPLSVNATLPVLLFSNAAFSLATGALGVTQDDSTNGVIDLAAFDCNGEVIASDVTFSITQSSTPVGEVYDLGTLDPALAGRVVVFNVPAGATLVGGVVGTHTLTAHTVTVTAGETVSTAVRPGFSAP